MLCQPRIKRKLESLAVNRLPLLIFYIIRYIHNRNTEFLCVLITFIRTAIITLDIDDHHIAVLGKPFVAFPYPCSLLKDLY